MRLSLYLLFARGLGPHGDWVDNLRRGASLRQWSPMMPPLVIWSRWELPCSLNNLSLEQGLTYPAHHEHSNPLGPGRPICPQVCELKLLGSARVGGALLRGMDGGRADIVPGGIFSGEVVGKGHSWWCTVGLPLNLPSSHDAGCDSRAHQGLGGRQVMRELPV